MKRIIISFMIGAILYGCYDDSTERVPGMDVTNGEILTLNALTDTGSTDITSGKQWKVIIPEADAGWLNADPSEGEGDTRITFTAGRNFGAVRSSNVKIQAETYYVNMNGASSTVTIEQKAASTAMQMLVRTTFGTEEINDPVDVADYLDWGVEGPGGLRTTYSATGSEAVIITPGTVSDGYSDASEANCLKFSGADQFTVSSIDTGEGGDMTLFFQIYNSDRLPVDPNIISGSYKAEPDGNWNDMEITIPDNQAGWSIAYADFSLPQGGLISVRLASTASCSVDDISLFLISGDASDLKFTPEVITYAADESDINIFNAAVSMKYLYPADVEPAITECGIAYRETDGNDWTTVQAEAYVAGVEYDVELEGLSQNTQYDYKGYTLDSEGNYTYGEVLHLTTKPYVPPTPVSSLNEPFNFSSAGVPFRGGDSNWNPWVSTEVNADGWLTAGSDDKKYLSAAPPQDVSAYQILPPLNMQSSLTGILYVNMSHKVLFPGGDGKLEVVVSENFEGSVSSASWTVVKDLTPALGTDPQEVWTDCSIDLLSYGTSTELYVALRATGSGVEYMIDDVLFGEHRKVQFADPVVTGWLKSTVESTVRIAIPYRFGDGSSNAVSLIPISGNVESVTSVLESGNGDYTDSLIYNYTATPATMDQITLDIIYPGTADYTQTSVTVNVADAQGYRPILDFPLVMNSGETGIVNCVQTIPAHGTITYANRIDTLSFTSNGLAAGDLLFSIRKYDPNGVGTGTHYGFCWQAANKRMFLGRSNWNSGGYALFYVKTSEKIWGDVWPSLPLFVANTTEGYRIQMEIDGQWEDAFEGGKGSEEASVRSFILNGRFYVPEQNAIPAGGYIRLKVYTSGANANTFIPTVNDTGDSNTAVIDPRIKVRYNPDYVPVP